MTTYRKNPYSFRRRKDAEPYVYRSLRVYPAFWEQLEILCAREQVSMNSLCMALFEVALDLDQTDAGRAAIHQACTAWRTRWEPKLTARRRARIAANAVEE